MTMNLRLRAAVLARAALGSSFLLGGAAGLSLLKKAVTSTSGREATSKTSNPKRPFLLKESAATDDAMPDGEVIPFLKHALEGTELPGISLAETQEARVTHDRARKTVRLDYITSSGTKRSLEAGQSGLPDAGKQEADSGTAVGDGTSTSSFAEREQTQETVVVTMKNELVEYCPEPDDFAADDDAKNEVYADLTFEAENKCQFTMEGGYPKNVVDASSVEIALYEDGLTGWTIKGKGRVSTKFSLDPTGGWVEFHYDASGVASGRINANFYATAQTNEVMNKLKKEHGGKETLETYCDGQPHYPIKSKGWIPCEEFDIWESCGNEGGAVTMHHANNDGNGGIIVDVPMHLVKGPPATGTGKTWSAPAPGSKFQWNQTESEGRLLLGGGEIVKWPRVWREVNTAKLPGGKGWRFHSSQWTGWTPCYNANQPRCNDRDDKALAKSTYKVRGFKGKWRHVAGPEPTRCVDGKVPPKTPPPPPPTEPPPTPMTEPPTTAPTVATASVPAPAAAPGEQPQSSSGAAPNVQSNIADHIQFTLQNPIPVDC